MNHVTISTERTELKFPLPYVSAEIVAEAIGDPETIRYMSAIPSMNYTVQDAQGFLGFLRYMETSDTDLELGIFLKPENTFVGMCTLENINRANGTCELGYWLCKKYVGQGYMSECAAALLRYAKNDLHMKSVNAFVNTEHKRSIALLERLGFVRKKRLENDVENKGVLVDRYWYELVFREEAFNMKDWFTIDQIDADTYIISEYRHWEETHCYLLNGGERSLLIDTGLGICNISEVVATLTDKPVTAVATHIHWDHIGGHKYFPDFYAHSEELDWLNGKFPLSMETIKEMVVDRCDLPDGFDVNEYVFFQGIPTRVLADHDVIDIGGRKIEVLHTPGHAPGHLCFWEKDRGYLYTGDLVYKDTLFAYYPSTDPDAYLASLEKIAALPAEKVFPAHHSLDIQPEILIRMRDAFCQLKADGDLHHGSGTFHYGDWAVWL